MLTGVATFDASTSQPAHTLVPAMQLLRMISCSRTAFQRHSGMLLRCVHVLRHISEIGHSTSWYAQPHCNCCSYSKFSCAMPSIFAPYTSRRSHRPACLAASCEPMTWADCAFLAQTHVAASLPLMVPPSERARLPHAAEHLSPSNPLGALAEGVTSITDFLWSAWRPRTLAPDEHYVSAFPSCCMGTRRTALYEDQVQMSMHMHGMIGRSSESSCQCRL